MDPGLPAFSRPKLAIGKRRSVLHKRVIELRLYDRVVRASSSWCRVRPLANFKACLRCLMESGRVVGPSWLPNCLSACFRALVCRLAVGLTS